MITEILALRIGRTQESPQSPWPNPTHQMGLGGGGMSPPNNTTYQFPIYRSYIINAYQVVDFLYNTYY
ncbi:hypothetical protein ACN38_g4130 [Penicillium nordicum]|uniref:Uncharacterized protein n=1 Tax=Penicillium nordicum TaxID=229535 RepID=A0A0M8PCK5_9EURO|nr:hypothetical protein ACN38_g4130 [Penicillium nordicum]